MRAGKGTRLSIHHQSPIPTNRENWSEIWERMMALLWFNQMFLQIGRIKFGARATSNLIITSRDLDFVGEYTRIFQLIQMDQD